MIDNKTTNLSLPLPHPDNTLAEDVARLRTALTSIDTAIAARPTGSDLAVVVGGLVGNAPANLNTIAEVAASIGNDPDFAGSIAQALTAKVSADRKASATGLGLVKVGTGLAITADGTLSATEAGLSYIDYPLVPTSENQRIFTVPDGYIPGQLDVYVNGIMLFGGGNDFTATNGIIFTLVDGIGTSDLILARRWSRGTGGDEYLPPAKPVNTSPPTGTTISTKFPTLTAGPYAASPGALHLSTQVQLSLTADFASIFYDTGALAATTSVTLQNPPIVTGTTYYWRIRYQSTRGSFSEWSIPTTFITATTFVAYITTPSNVTPANATTLTTSTPTFVSSAYSSPAGGIHTFTQIQFSLTANFALIAYDTGNLPASTSVTLPQTALNANTSYYWRVRYLAARGEFSDWSTPTIFTTLAVYPNYIPTPEPTPAVGAPFQGGFYSGGLIWNEVTQSTTQQTIGLGTKTFIVPDMTVTPLFYAGQIVEIRHTADQSTGPNPSRMFGTVTLAGGTTLSVNVTSTGSNTGATLTAWSIMAQYRLIVAPRASGSTTLSPAIKSANSALPVESLTGSEGFRSTNAMFTTDVSGVYPGAWFCRTLNIGGFTDWYMPARDELELCYKNLKPTTATNLSGVVTAAITNNWRTRGGYAETGGAPVANGTNYNSTSPSSGYSTTVPAQTAVPAFISGGSEAFAVTAPYATSSDPAPALGYTQEFTSGGQSASNSKTTSPLIVRAVRRSII